jgi:hypothetical protein
VSTVNVQADESQSREHTQRPWLLALLCAALAALAFAPALGGDWIRDDGPLISDNRYVQGFGWWTRWFTHDLWDVDHYMAQRLDRVSYWRPLISASYALDWMLGGGSPVIFHATNLLWHALVGLLCFFTLRRWCGSGLGALAGTLIFVLHPTKAESVAWITGRTDIAVTVALLLATTGIGLRLRGRRCGLALEVAGTALAYMVKEQAVVLPLVAAIEGWVAAGRPALTRDLARLRSPVLRAALPHVAVACAYLAFRMLALPLRRFEVSGLSLATHAGLVLETIGRYVWTAVWPADLSMDWSAIRSTTEGLVVGYRYAALGLAALVGSIWAVLGWRRRRPELSVALAFTLLCLVPVSNVVWGGFVTLTAHRFWYLPMLGIALAVASAVTRARRSRVALGVACAAALALGARTMVRSADFSAYERFWDYELEQNPDVPVALKYAVERDLREGRARTALRRAACAHAVATRFSSHTGEAGTFILTASEILSGLTPDAQHAELEAVHRFARAVLEGRPDPAVLRTRELQLVVPQDGKAALELRKRAPHLELLLADIDSRLQRDAQVLACAGRAVAGCPRCPRVLGKAALVAARAGRFEQAERWQRMAEAMLGAQTLRAQRQSIEAAQGLAAQAAAAPERFAARLQAQRHALLGAWGRAYAELRPHREEIEQAGAAPALQYAKLAYRAGEFGVARALLQRHLPGRKAELVAEWAKAAGWDDAGRSPPPGWSPEQGCAW